MKTILVVFVFLVSLPCWAQTAHYRHDGPAVLPDPTVTPGAVRPDATKEQLCAKGFTTKAYRHTTEAMKRQVCAEYGVAACPHAGDLEIDHLVPLTDGGDDVIQNLWPQPAAPKPGFHEKDHLEVRLHAMICKGQISLADAQACLMQNWAACYRRIFGAEAH